MNESFHEIYYPLNQQYFTEYFCLGFINLLAANTFSLLLILPVFTMLVITPRGIPPPEEGNKSTFWTPDAPK